MSHQFQLETTIAFLESRRDTLGKELVDEILLRLRKEQIAPDRDNVDRRKQVTVLFADLSNFTAMSECMDAEDVRNVVQSLWARIDKEIIDHGGTIDKHIGDAVMALWGIEQTREDDPERAVSAALAMQDALRAWRKEMETVAPSIAEMDPPVSIRIGINTGTVILGLVGTKGEFTAIGDTVNTASRLEAAAPLGNILISQSTFLHVRGLFELREREPIQVKGKSKPLATYLVQSARPHRFKSEQRGIEGVATPMIGRLEGLEFLQNCFFEVLLENQPQFIMLTGEAGVGKSRLIYEFNSWMESQSWRTSYFKGRCRRTTSQESYSLLHNLIANRFSIEADDSPKTIQNKLELGFFNEWEPDADIQKRTHYIARLANFSLESSRFLSDAELSGEEWKADAKQFTVEFFKAVSFTEPTVILLEDVHWADWDTLNLLIQTLDESSDQILMIVCTARPFGSADIVKRIGQSPYYNQYVVAALNDTESRELIDEILRNAEEVPAKIYDLIIPRAGGNPYYIEEFIKMFVNDQAIVKDADKWTIVPEKLVADNVPTTLASVLEARLDNISTEALQVFQYATVIGEHFWFDAIDYMTRALSQEGMHTNGATDTGSANGSKDMAGVNGTASDGLNDTLLEKNIAYLIDSGLIRQCSTSTYPWTQEYEFTNASLKQVSYNRILKREREHYHAVATQWIEQQTLPPASHRNAMGEIEETPTPHTKSESSHTSPSYSEIEDG